MVDQIGRLVNRKAFAKFKSIGDEVPNDVTAPITNDNGFGPDRLEGWSWVDNVITMTNPNAIGFVTPSQMDGFDGDPTQTTYTLQVTISFKDKETGLIADPPADFPERIGALSFDRGGVRPRFPYLRSHQKTG